jgi:spermidine/putrescine transport system ATP-binding protein
MGFIKNNIESMETSFNGQRRPLIELVNLSKEYNGQIVLKGIDLTIFENEFVTLLGPSGCGKTTTLRIIGGFEEPTSGNVYFDGKDIKSVPTHLRSTNTVFQRYALFPHLDVFENVAFGLRIKNRHNRGIRGFVKEKFKKIPLEVTLTEAEIEEKVKSMLKLVGLEGYENRLINKLSGGQMQRVAIARALVNSPKVLLLDEPLAALDLKLRQEMQYELKELQRKTGTTFIFVTHDQEEALTMSDKIVVMHEGIIQQVGSPTDIYNEPINRFVAQFIGESNIVEGHMIKDYLVAFDGQEFECVDRGFGVNQPVDIVIRPEDIDIVKENEGKINGVIDSVVFKGVHYEIDVKTDKRVYTIHTTDYHPLGTKVGITFEPSDLHIMEKENYAHL